MALRIDEFLFEGELRNTTNNSVFGWIGFAPDWGVRIELAGNLTGELAGKHIKFRIKKPVDEVLDIDDFPDFIAGMADRQIGAIGEVVYCNKSVSQVPAGTSEDQDCLPATEGVAPCLYLEWFSQDGRVVAEIPDPIFEFVMEDQDTQTSPVPDPEEKPYSGSGETGEDEFRLFDGDLDQRIHGSLRHDSETPEVEDPDVVSEGGSDNPESVASKEPRAWDEVIPGLDSETKALYETWDEIYGGEKEESVAGLFESPYEIPPLESITTDDEAQPVLNMIIGRLAVFNIAIELCEHCTPLSAFKHLVDDILPIATVHPNLAATEIIQHYCVWEFCPQCKAEFEEEC